MRTPTTALIALVLCVAVDTIAAPPRLAIVDVGVKTKTPAAIHDLLYVSFPDEPPVVLLERTDIDRLLREQTLSQSMGDGIAAEDAVQAGKLWTVDAFLMFDTTPSTEDPQLRLRLVDTRYGLKLMDESFLLPTDAAQYEQVAANTAGRVARKLSVVNRSPDEMVCVSVGGFESAEVAPRWKWLAEEIPHRLEQSLQLSSQILVLERRKTRLLAEERAFSYELPPELAAASVLVDGEYRIATDGNTPIVSVAFRVRHGTNILFTGGADGAAGIPALAHDISVKIHALFELGDALPAMDPAGEARMLVSEVKLCRDVDRALDLADAAIALQPDDMQYQFLAIDTAASAMSSRLFARARDDLQERDFEVSTQLADYLIKRATAFIPYLPSAPLVRSGEAHYTSAIEKVFWALDIWDTIHHLREERNGNTPLPFPEHLKEGYWTLYDAYRQALLEGEYGRRLVPSRLRERVTLFLARTTDCFRWCSMLDEALGRCRQRLEDEELADRGIFTSSLHSLVQATSAKGQTAIWASDPRAPVRVLSYLRELKECDKPWLRSQAGRTLSFFNHVHQGMLTPEEGKDAASVIAAREKAGRHDPHKVLRDTQAQARELFYEKGDFAAAKKTIVDALPLVTGKNRPINRSDNYYYDLLSDLLSRIERENAMPPSLRNERYVHRDLITKAEATDVLYRSGGWRNYEFAGMLIDGDVAIISVVGKASSGLGVLFYDISKGVLSKARTYRVPTPNLMDIRPNPRAVPAAAPQRMASLDGNVYMGFPGAGLVVFSADGTIRRLTEENGLVSQKVHSLCALAGKLYALVDWTGLNPTHSVGLMELDPETGRSRLMLNKNTKFPSCPIDGHPIIDMACDEEKGALLLHVSERAGESSGVAGLHFFYPAAGNSELVSTNLAFSANSRLVVAHDFYFMLLNSRAYRIDSHHCSDAKPWTVYSRGNRPDAIHPQDGVYERNIVSLGDQALLLSETRDLVLFSKGTRSPELIQHQCFEHYSHLRSKVRQIVMSPAGLLLLTTEELYLFPEFTAEGIKK